MSRRKGQRVQTGNEVAEIVKSNKKVAATKIEHISSKAAAKSDGSSSDERMKDLFNEANLELLNQIKRNSPKTTPSGQQQNQPPVPAPPAFASYNGGATRPGQAQQKRPPTPPQTLSNPQSQEQNTPSPPKFTLTKSIELAMDEGDGTIRPPPLEERFSASIFDAPIPKRAVSAEFRAAHWQRQQQQQQQQKRQYQLQQQQLQQQQQQSQQQPAVFRGNRKSNNDLIGSDDDDDDEPQQKPQAYAV